MFFNKFTLAVIVLFAGFAADGGVVLSAQTVSDKNALRVMTFNIRLHLPSDGVNAWPNRKDKVAGVIRFHKADLVGLQEALIDQLKDLDTLLPDLARCGVGRDDGKTGGEFSAILFSKSRFRLLECSTFWLSETPERPGSMGWDAAYPRVVTWAKFHDRTSRKTFFQFNTHFDHRGEEARRKSAELLVTQMKQIVGRLPFVVTGDFNFTESSPAYQILTGKDPPNTEKASVMLKDARYESVNGHFGPTSTFNNFGALIADRKIDYILVANGIKVLEHAVLADQWDGKWASDHLPVLAEIVI